MSGLAPILITVAAAAFFLWMMSAGISSSGPKTHADDADDADGADAPGAVESLSNDEIETLALRMLRGRPGVYVSFGSPPDQCDELKAWVVKQRTSYATIEPKRLRSYIMGWLDYFEREARDAEREWHKNQRINAAHKIVKGRK